MPLVQKTDEVVHKVSSEFYEDLKDLDKFIDSGKYTYTLQLLSPSSSLVNDF